MMLEPFEAAWTRASTSARFADDFPSAGTVRRQEVVLGIQQCRLACERRLKLPPVRLPPPPAAGRLPPRREVS